MHFILANQMKGTPRQPIDRNARHMAINDVVSDAIESFTGRIELGRPRAYLH